MVRYAISAVPGAEAETAGAHLADGCERTDPAAGRYEVATYIEASSLEEAQQYALAYYGLEG